VTDGDRVLVLVRASRAGPEGRPEVRLPKGHVEPGESREETARREVGEEAGLLQARSWPTWATRRSSLSGRRGTLSATSPSS